LQDGALPVGMRGRVFIPPKAQEYPSRGHGEPGTDVAGKVSLQGGPRRAPPILSLPVNFFQPASAEVRHCSVLLDCTELARGKNK